MHCKIRRFFLFFLLPSLLKYMFQPSSPGAAVGYRGRPPPVSGGYCRSSGHACLDVALVVKGGVINAVTPPLLPLAERGESVERAKRASLNINSMQPAAERKKIPFGFLNSSTFSMLWAVLQWTVLALSILQGEN